MEVDIYSRREMMTNTLLEKVFKIEERKSSVKTEVIGGVTTFLAMAYIIFVNPAILSLAGMDKGALITVTCLATAIGTFLAAFIGNVPIAMAPGMGLNAFFTFTLVMGKGVPWQDALGVVFISGVFFFILAASGLREKLASAIPTPITIASTAGIGLFIAFIGLKNMGIIVADPATLVALGKFDLPVTLSILGLVLMAIFELKKVRGGILISIVIITVLGMILGLVELPKAIISMPPSIEPIAFKLNIFGAFKISLFGSIFSFMFIDLFDSLGFLIACFREIGLVDEKGKYKGLGRMMFADVSSTIIGACLSTVTTFGESAAGIAAGAKTGLASFVTAILFLLALLVTPLVGIVPMFAAAPSLVMVGVFMFKSVRDLDLSDIKIAVPAFVTIIFMPLTYSISIGLSFGFVSYIIMHAVAKEWNKINTVLWIIGALSLVNLIWR
jgi:AGZA family xanthine/uracil permease-like MFS transporter